MTGCPKYAFALLGILAIAACSREQETGPTGGAPTEPVKVTTRVTSDGNYAGTTVLVFRKTAERYVYASRFDGPWNPNGTATVALALGDYRFIFFRSPSLYTVANDPEPGVTEPHQIVFTAKTDAAGNVLPVDEIFLPSEAEVAVTYNITGPTTIQSRITRAVSRVDVLLKRGHNNGAGFVEIPYTGGGTVLDELDNLSIEIAGVGKTLTLNGTQGNGVASVRYVPAQAAEVTAEGFASFTGPLIFPPAANGVLDITATYTPVQGSPSPTLTGAVTSSLLKNNALEVTLWITGDYKFIDITTENRPIQTETEGDSGLWQ